MNVLLNLVTYSAVALLVWWVVGECSATPAAKILDRWKRIPSLRVRVKELLLPLVVAPLPVPILAPIETAENVSTRPSS